MSGIIVAIDGPAASGKSTTARAVAKELDLLYIDTGAMYRAATLLILNENLQSARSEELVACIKTALIEQKVVSGEVKTYLNGKDVSVDIRKRNITLYIGTIASNTEIREIMVSQQQFMGKDGNVILDGRDIGTVVFPHADFKFFMIASIEERAKRRFLEFKEYGNSIQYSQVINDIKARDLSDEMRLNGPLKKAEDAVLIDTSRMNIEQQVEFITATIKTKKNTGSK